MTRILVAINDSPAGVAAARAAIWLAAETRATVLAVHVVAGDAPDQRAPARALEDAQLRGRQSSALLQFVAELADAARVVLQTRTLRGPPARAILDQAATWEADVIMLGRSGVRHVGQPFVGSQVLHVLEFADVPVVVVPAA